MTRRRSAGNRGQPAAKRGCGRTGACSAKLDGSQTANPAPTGSGTNECSDEVTELAIDVGSPDLVPALADLLIEDMARFPRPK